MADGRKGQKQAVQSGVEDAGERKETKSKDIEPVISTILLNWNRADLLEKTLESYDATTTVPHELIVIDNGSTDDSRAVVERFVKKRPEVQTIFLSENEGGAALNHGIERAKGAYIHLSENDLEYQPAWDQYCLEVFEAFPKLGQLSVYGPVPTDEEAWEVKPCTLLHKGGSIIYSAHGNVCTSSILRRAIFDMGIRVENMETGSFKFPNDFKLSADVKAKGYIVAWAAYYLVRNFGHSGSEMEARRDYYDANYSSKPWVGLEGWDRRLDKWRKGARPIRRSHLFPNEKLSPEISPQSEECNEPQLWTMLDGHTPEVEALEFIYSLVRLVKPRFVLETGTWLGAGALAIGTALKNNGRGHLVTLEGDHGCHEFSKRRIENAGLADMVEPLEMPSLQYNPEKPIDFLYLNGAFEARREEFLRFLPRLVPGATVIFHATPAQLRIVGGSVRSLLEEGYIQGLFLQTPRGIVVSTYTGKRLQATQPISRAGTSGSAP